MRLSAFPLFSRGCAKRDKNSRAAACEIRSPLLNQFVMISSILEEFNLDLKGKTKIIYNLFALGFISRCFKMGYAENGNPKALKGGGWAGENLCE